MVLMNLSAGKEWRRMSRMDLWIQLWKETAGFMEKAVLPSIHYHV